MSILGDSVTRGFMSLTRTKFFGKERVRQNATVKLNHMTEIETVINRSAEQDIEEKRSTLIEAFFVGGTGGGGVKDELCDEERKLSWRQAFIRLLPCFACRRHGGSSSLRCNLSFGTRY